ncbi:hypothetical protein MVEN_00580200 [Mycena venus]|uniref:BTB domain-containing protein n=1 Tax=Mycena venus TaxID=2733690 RepID=A0A8H7D861_9AGAR|nr:hypothetical protein MVEN_00580200 [Mycena venus]
MSSSLFTTTPSEKLAPEPLRDSYYLETVVFKVLHVRDHLSKAGNLQWQALQVENTLFKVPRFQFERSRKFAPFGIFWLPEGAPGTSDKTPFKIGGVNCLEFRVLLKVLYPLSPIPKVPELNKDEWITVLNLANVFDFIEVRNLAIQELTAYAKTLECIERILFARKYHAQNPISSEEAVNIGWDVALQIYQLREAAVASEGGCKSPYDKIDLGTSFEAELERVDSAHRPVAQILAERKLPKSSPATGSAALSSNGAAPPTLSGPSNPNPFNLNVTGGFTFKAATSIAPLQKDPVTFKNHNSDAGAPTTSESGPSSSGPQTGRVGLNLPQSATKTTGNTASAPTFKNHNSDAGAPTSSESGPSSSGPQTGRVVPNLPQSATKTTGKTTSAPTVAAPASASDAFSGSGATKNASAEVMGS